MRAGDTIFALSSGAPPCAIAIIRISGDHAFAAVESLAGRLPAVRRPSLATLRDANGDVLDKALLLLFRGPDSATGEDLAELHLHGGRAVVRSVEAALAAMPELRAAQAGEFTKRAFLHGRVDLNEAEGLSDLLMAETEHQRRSAVSMFGGAFSRAIETWRLELLRVYQLALLRLGPASASTIEGIIARLGPQFPLQSRDVNIELGKLLTHLQDPTFAGKALPIMANAKTQEEQMDYATMLRSLTAGWTPELRRQYFAWFNKAAGYRGGASFAGFVSMIKTDAVAKLSPATPPGDSRSRNQTTAINPVATGRIACSTAAVPAPAVTSPRFCRP